MSTESITINPDDLTLGEVEAIEEVVGKPFSEAFAGAVSAKAAIALVYVVKRRDNPDFTLDDARAYKIADLELGAGADPTNGSGSLTSLPSATSGA